MSKLLRHALAFCGLPLLLLLLMLAGLAVIGRALLAGRKLLQAGLGGAEGVDVLIMAPEPPRPPASSPAPPPSRPPAPPPNHVHFPA